MRDLDFHLEVIQAVHSKQNRKWDKTIPYWTHPLWCAMMILSEPILTYEERQNGALALLYHDVIEIGRPDVVPNKVLRYVKEMTFDGFDHEMLQLMSKSEFIIMLKLYDKTHNLLDSHWMDKKRLNEYKCHTLRLIEKTEEVYGNLQICKIARGLI